MPSVAELSECCNRADITRQPERPATFLSALDRGFR